MLGDSAWSMGTSTEQTMANNAGESGSPCRTPDSGVTCTSRTTPLPTPKTKGEVSMFMMSAIICGGRPRWVKKAIK